MRFDMFWRKRQSTEESEEPSQDIKKEKFRLRLPVAVKVIYLIAGACIPLYVILLCSTGFSDFFNRYISSVFRAVTATLTGWIPFSLAYSWSIWS